MQGVILLLQSICVNVYIYKKSSELSRQCFKIVIVFTWGWPVGAETCCDTERYNNINKISQLRLRVCVWKILTKTVTAKKACGKWRYSFIHPEGSVPTTHCIRGWVGPTVNLDAVVKRRNSWHCKKSNNGHQACSLISVQTLH
jgi:hypothetical protein